MTYREIIYSILDLSKQLNDDIIIDEEHVLFLVDKIRAALLWQKYKTVKLDVPDSNYQTLCLDLEEAAPIVGNPCEGQNYLRSIACLPKLMEIGNTVVFPQDFYQGINICIVDKERMRYVGENPFTRNIIYCSINADGRLYFTSKNPQFLYLKKIRLTGVFEDPMKASEYECGTCVDNPCEELDRIFPLEEALISTLIDTAVKEVVGAAYRPADQKNNSSDDLADIASFVRQNTKSNLQKQIEA